MIVTIEKKYWGYGHYLCYDGIEVADIDSVSGVINPMPLSEKEVKTLSAAGVLTYPMEAFDYIEIELP